jgi:uncharacterized membrane protein YfcA
MPVTYILIGLVGGLGGGALGLGGGAIMVPLLVFWAGLTQHQAQGTVIAVLTVPVFLLAALRYHAVGNLKIQIALFVASGFVVGALLGAHLIQGIPDAALKRAFGVFLILMGIKMVFFK